MYKTLKCYYTRQTWLNQPSNVSIQGHGDWHPRPHQDSQHVGVLAHPAPTGPTQQGQGYFARTPCCTTGLTLQPSGILLLLCHYLINICFAFTFRLVGYLGLTRLYPITHYPLSTLPSGCTHQPRIWLQNRAPTNPLQGEVLFPFLSQAPAFSERHQLQWQLCSIPSTCLQWRSSPSAQGGGTLHPPHLHSQWML